MDHEFDHNFDVQPLFFIYHYQYYFMLVFKY